MDLILNTPWELPVLLLFALAVTGICLVLVWGMKKLRVYPILFPTKKAVERIVQRRKVGLTDAPADT